MKIAIIGRTEVLYETALALFAAGHHIVCVLTAKEAPEYTRTATDFQMLAAAWKIPFAEGPRIGEHIEFLRDAGAEIAVSINYTGVVPQPVINLFPYGVLNAHGGDLPRYRGNACQAWAIINGENHIGLCIHKMIGDELDSGDIIARDYLKINHTTKITAAWQWIAEKTPTLMLEAVQQLAKNPHYVLERQSCEPKDALRCYPRRPEDGRIDWHKSAIDVLRLINASNKPYAGAYCDFEGQKLIVWDAELVPDDENFCAVPGQVTALAEGAIEIACLTGRLRLKLVELANQVMPPGRCISSIRKRLT